VSGWSRVFWVWAMVLCPTWHLTAYVTGLAKIPDTYRLLFGGAGLALSFLAGTVATWSLLVGDVVRRDGAGAVGKAMALSWGTLALDGMLAAILVLTEAFEQFLAGPVIDIGRSTAVALPFILVLPIPMAWIAYLRCSVGAAKDSSEKPASSRRQGFPPDSAMHSATGAHVLASAALLPVAVLTALAVGHPSRIRSVPERGQDDLYELTAIWYPRMALALVGVLAAGFLTLLLLQWLGAD
jgi:hypothetical protein